MFKNWLCSIARRWKLTKHVVMCAAPEKLALRKASLTIEVSAHSYVKVGLESFNSYAIIAYL